ncbi:protein-glutamine gamma-glutamyltransferase 4-like isoform X2 [Xenia sp. Carnegie-2017]|uniref:protein-glutamine gamma-glutamyltransferase 4-like isoform X2 n=1 Tax=Xenia sp. Carnegie-2017 TaxID=2897299 RepID=UPI001F039A87|nr:protein-glutamine gamma-glutamyltransferase 4-like isoform X2 [Xenia sp. Carnegie-2017]
MSFFAICGRKKSKSNSASSKEGSVSFNYHKQENSSLHHTEEYDEQNLVLRRGFTFQLSAVFENFSQSEIKDAGLRFSIGANDRFIQPRIWENKVIESNENEQKFEVKIPVNAAVGRYKVEVVLPNSSSRPLGSNEEIVVLFNAWHQDDEVYLPDDDSNDKKQEYVLNDDGLLYAGWSNYRGPNPVRWNFGQFEKDILECVFYLLENDRRIRRKPSKSLIMRSDAVWVSRILSAMINSQDDNGVLMGNWTGNYENGRSPTFWNGSVNILQEYYRTKKPVRYGQCWVFSGVLTTVLRAIGIPARSVTNYDSAHDTDNTMTIDKFINEEGEDVDELNHDSVWNFHVWNEIWTKRPDLPNNKYDGWQAVDSTPQEESNKIYQMGPAPVSAVKNGEIYAGFDTGFVFGEVNADRVTWLVKRDRYGYYVIQKTTQRSTSRVGSYISTKKVGSTQREDLTLQYKYREGSDEERKSFETAYSFGAGPRDLAGFLHVEEEGQQLDLVLGTKEENLLVGEPITCYVTAKNKTNKGLTISLTAVIRTIRYNGNVSYLVKTSKFDEVNISSQNEITKEVVLQPEEYVEKLVDLNCFTFVVVAKEIETEKYYVDEAKFQLFNPDAIQVKFDHLPLHTGKNAEVEVIFTNPLPVRLSNIKISIEGAGLLHLTTKTFRKSLQPDEKQTATFSFSPRKSGQRTLLVDVDTTQVKNFKTSVDVTVKRSSRFS